MRSKRAQQNFKVPPTPGSKRRKIWDVILERKSKGEQLAPSFVLDALGPASGISLATVNQVFMLMREIGEIPDMPLEVLSQIKRDVHGPDTKFSAIRAAVSELQAQGQVYISSTDLLAYLISKGRTDIRKVTIDQLFKRLHREGTLPYIPRGVEWGMRVQRAFIEKGSESTKLYFELLAMIPEEQRGKLVVTTPIAVEMLASKLITDYSRRAIEHAVDLLHWRGIALKDTSPTKKKVIEGIVNELLAQGITSISPLDVFDRLPKDNKFSHITVNHVFIELHRSGKLKCLTYAERAQLARERNRDKGKPQSIAYAMIKAMVSPEERGRVSFSTVRVFELLKPDHPDMKYTHVGNAFVHLRREGILRTITTDERSEIIREAAKRMGAKSAVIYEYLFTEVLGDPTSDPTPIAIPLQETANILRKRGHRDINSQDVLGVVQKLKKAGLARHFTPEELSKMRKEMWKRVPKELRSALMRMLTQANLEGLSYDDSCDLLTLFEAISFWRMKKDEAFFYAPRYVKEEKLLRHVQSPHYELEIAGYPITYEEPHQDAISFAIKEVLKTKNKGMLRGDLSKSLIDAGYSKQIATYAINSLLDIGALAEFGPGKHLGKKYLIVYPCWWTERKMEP